MSSPDAAAAPVRSQALRGVAFLVGAAAAAVAAGRAGLDVDALPAAAFVALLTAIAVVDLEERRVPNRLVVPGIAVALAVQALLHWDRILECVIAGAGAGVFFLAAKLISRNSVGMGDVKLVVLMGVVLGQDILAALLVTGLASAVVAAIVLARGGLAARKRAMPFAPFLAVGAVAALLVGSPPLYS